MKITFILPYTGISGGAKVVFEFANCLKAKGHTVTVIYPLFPLSSGPRGYDIKSWINRIGGALLNVIRGNRINWFDLKAKLSMVSSLSEANIPDADVIVATWWETAYFVNKYSPHKGKKFYLSQHYETWGGPEEKVANSYKLNLRIIVNSGWLKTILQNKLNLKGDIIALILFAPNWNDLYYENIIRDKKYLSILMPYRKEEWKGRKDGIKTFEIVRKEFPDLHFVMFGLERGKDIPSYVEFHKKPYKSELRRIYNLCDIFVFPSRSEGFGMPPMEAMACRRAVVTTHVGAVPEYTIPGQTALVCPPGNPQELAQNIIKLIKDKELRDKIAENGYNYIKQFTWEKATEQLEHLFMG